MINGTVMYVMMTGQSVKKPESHLKYRMDFLTFKGVKIHVS